MCVTVTLPQAVHFMVPNLDQVRSGARCEPRTNHVSGSQSVERERTGLQLSTGSEPTPKMRWWKRGNKGLCLLYEVRLVTLTAITDLDLDTTLYSKHQLITAPVVFE